MKRERERERERIAKIIPLMVEKAYLDLRLDVEPPSCFAIARK